MQKRGMSCMIRAKSDPSCTVRRISRESGTRGQPHCLHHQQPEREERRNRGANIDPHGFDAGKLIKSKKRHILVDMQGLLLHAIVHSAGVQDRDGGIWLLATLFGQFPFLAKLLADSAYAGPIFDAALDKVLPNLKSQIGRRSDRAKGFAPLPKRWIVERTIAWLNRCRRLAKDCENLNRSALAFLQLASNRLMLRKLCNP
jgi:putative transposase